MESKVGELHSRTWIIKNTILYGKQLAKLERSMWAVGCGLWPVDQATGQPWRSAPGWLHLAKDIHLQDSGIIRSQPPQAAATAAAEAVEMLTSCANNRSGGMTKMQLGPWFFYGQTWTAQHARPLWVLARISTYACVCVWKETCA